MQNFQFTDHTCLMGMESPQGPTLKSQGVARNWHVEEGEGICEVWAGGWCLFPSWVLIPLFLSLTQLSFSVPKYQECCWGLGAECNFLVFIRSRPLCHFGITLHTPKISSLKVHSTGWSTFVAERLWPSFLQSCLHRLQPPLEAGTSGAYWVNFKTWNGVTEREQNVKYGV